MASKKIKPAEVLTSNIQGLVEAFGDDTDLLLFYVSWIKNGLNAGAAYRELHPDVTEHSSRTLGSRLLAKVDKETVMAAYGLDLQLYFEQLQDGLKATKWNDFTGEREADHATRKPYHDKLGKQLGVETDKAGTQVNVAFKDGNTIMFVNFKNETES